MAATPQIIILKLKSIKIYSSSQKKIPRKLREIISNVLMFASVSRDFMVYFFILNTPFVENSAKNELKIQVCVTIDLSFES